MELNKISDLPVSDKQVERILFKPCPFCGPNMTEHLRVVDSKEGPAKVVKCWACGCIGPYGASNELLAVSFWNNRFPVGASEQ